MAIIYSYPPVASLQTTDLFIISRLPEDPDEISNFSVTLNSISTYIIDRAFNGTDNYIPKFDGTASLVNSIIYQDDDGHVGIGVPGSTPNPVHKFEVYDDRSENVSSDYTQVNSTVVGPPYTGGAGGFLSRLSTDGGSTFPYGISLIPGTIASDIASADRMAFHANSDLDTRAPSGYSGQVTFDGANPHWILGGSVTDTTTRTLHVKGDMLVDTDLEVDGGLDVAGTVRLGFTGNDPVIFGNPTGKRTEWNNPGYFEIYAENPFSPGDFNETVDIDGEYYGGGFVGVYPANTEDTHGVRMHVITDPSSAPWGSGFTSYFHNFIDIAKANRPLPGANEQNIRISDIYSVRTTGEVEDYAGIKINHPTENRFRFNSEFSIEPTVPFLVNSSSKFTGQVTIPLTPIADTDAASKGYVDTAVTGLLDFKGTFRADTGEILSGANNGLFLYNCPGGAGTRVAVAVGDYYIVANAGGSFYCSGDLLNTGDSVFAVADAAADSSTISDWGIVESDNIEGSGTANKIPLWTNSQVLSDSLLSQDALATRVIVGGDISSQGAIEGESLTINTGPSTITGELDKDGSKITNLADPTVAQDAATKAYVDAVDLDFTGNSGTGNVQQGSTFDILGSGPITTSASGTTLTINSSAAEGTGTTQTLPIWSDGPAGVLGDSTIRNYNPSGSNQTHVEIATIGGNNPLVVDFATGGSTIFKRGTVATGFTNFIKFANDNSGFYTNNFSYVGTLSVGRNQQALAATLDVGNSTDTIPAAWFRNGVVISNNPGGVQVDNTSMVIGAGNNDNVSGSDHCLIVGSGNQITNNSDQSVAFGQGNSITGSTDATAAGNQNIITTSSRSLALGSQNQITNATSSFAAGGENIVPSGSTNMVLGYQNTAASGGSNYILGNVITGASQTMVLGFRNDTASYPTADRNLGLGLAKFVVAVGSSTTTNANAVIITEGGVNGGSSGTVPQVPRVILPTVVNFNFVDDAAAAAGGIPIGGLYHNAGVIRIRLT